MGIAMSFAKTPVPLFPIRINTFGSRLVLDLLVSATDLTAGGGSMMGVQSLFMETHDKFPSIWTGFPIREYGGKGQSQKTKDVRQLHLERTGTPEDNCVLMMMWAVCGYYWRDIDKSGDCCPLRYEQNLRDRQSEADLLVPQQLKHSIKQ
jgi:hypothetical protein